MLFLRIALLFVVLVVPPSSAAFVMDDVTESAGLANHGASFHWGFPTFRESFAAGACWGDADNDGWMDLYVTDLLGANGTGTARLYRNLGGSTVGFEDATQQTGAGVVGITQACVWGDFNNDGWSDLFVSSVGTNYTSQTHTLLRNDAGVFTDVTHMGVSGGTLDPFGPGGCDHGADETGSGEACWGASAAWLDYDLDGDLDLYVLHYARFGTGTCIQLTAANPVFCQGQHNRLYRNDGAAFTDVTQEAGVAGNGLPTHGRSLGVIATDIDGDAWPDLWVANDMDGNALYLNNRNGTFTNAAQRLGASNLGPLVYERPSYRAGMGVDAADFDNDGDLDLLSTHMVNEYDGLWVAQDGKYEDRAKQLGIGFDIATGEARWGAALVDLDLDGWKDVVMVTGSPGRAAPGGIHLLWNRDGQFVQPDNGTWPWLTEAIANYRGASFADVDNDGDLDLYASALPDHTGARNSKLLLNQAEGNWLRVELVGTANARDAFGTRLDITAGELTQTYTKASGGSYGGNHDPRLLIGLGAATEGTIQITWPGGATQHATFSLADSNQLRIVEETQLHHDQASPIPALAPLLLIAIAALRRS